MTEHSFFSVRSLINAVFSGDRLPAAVALRKDLFHAVDGTVMPVLILKAVVAEDFSASGAFRQSSIETVLRTIRLLLRDQILTAKDLPADGTAETLRRKLRNKRKQQNKKYEASQSGHHGIPFPDGENIARVLPKSKKLDRLFREKFLPFLSLNLIFRQLFQYANR